MAIRNSIRRRHQRQPAGQIMAARARGRNSTEM
jgi:hypothetical protein